VQGQNNVLLAVLVSVGNRLAMRRNRASLKVSTLSIGIDNGLSGGVAVLDGQSKLLERRTMPVVEGKRGRELNVVALDTWMREVCKKIGVEPCDVKLTVEQPGGSKSYRAAVSMAGCFHSLRAMADIGEWRMLTVTPQKWQKELLMAAAGDTKPAALRLANKLWPEERWLENERCRTAHDGMVDAALLAHWRLVNKV